MKVEVAVLDSPSLINPRFLWTESNTSTTTGVTSSGRVWRKVPESDARSVPRWATSTFTQRLSSDIYWAIQRSWFTRVNALCNLSRKKSRDVAAHFRADF